MKEYPSSTAGNSRRSFLGKVCASALATIALPSLGNAEVNGNSSIKPRIAKSLAPDENFWGLVKRQFTVPPNLIMVNAANLCPSPYFIQDKVIELTKTMGHDVSFQYRNSFIEKRVEALASLAQFVSVSKDEIAITRNTSESNNFIVNGLDFKSGDEIILWDQNHPTNGTAWEQRAKRFGYTVKRVTVPSSPKTMDELISPFVKAMTSRTKLLGFSHISNTSGIALPAKELCSLARGKGILTLLDGAQSFGMMDLNLKDIGCDFYTSSSHKWFMGPLENGILYIRRELMDRVWPSMVGAGWKPDAQTVDEKFSSLGQRNETTVAAIPEMLQFHNTLGKKNIEARVRQLSGYLSEKIKAELPQTKFISPADANLRAGVVIIELGKKDTKEIYQKLYDTHGIACASTGGIRISPHIYNTLEEMDRIVGALISLSA